VILKCTKFTFGHPVGELPTFFQAPCSVVEGIPILYPTRRLWRLVFGTYDASTSAPLEKCLQSQMTVTASRYLPCDRLHWLDMHSASPHDFRL